MNSKDITVTEPRFKEAVGSFINEVTTPNINKKVNTAIENERIKTGVITKFYPYLDKAMVKLDNTNKTVLCKILHRFTGDLIDFYTPLENEQIFDDELKEPAIIPRAAQHVLVANINDKDSEENLILGYYLNEEVVGFSPAKPGNIKFMSLTESNPFWVKFGRDGLECRLPSNPRLSSGVLDKDMVDVEYADKSEVYSKEEVDDIIEHLPHGDMSDYVRKDRILLDYGVDFTYTLGVGAMNEDYITIEPFLIEKNRS